ncbi:MULTISPECIES: hypothetical protein [unclassified Lysobacter]|uniref:hypothetical protein n=1 Tax=unclassified Lysobacter TaxID=2635362 RepID=UPI002036363E|nr:MULTISPECIES: hypothetical protein [unclassified Lysobacter]
MPVNVVPGGTLRPPLGTSGVGQTSSDDPDAAASVRGVDGASWNNNRPAGVAFGFQVSENSVECQRDDASNIFTQECSGSRGCNKAMQFRPEVTVIRPRALSARDAEGLAREAARPDRFLVGPAGEPAGVGKAADPGEEVALAVAAQIVCGNRSDVAVIDVARWDQAGSNQVSQPMA